MRFKRILTATFVVSPVSWIGWVPDPRRVGNAAQGHGASVHACGVMRWQGLEARMDTPTAVRGSATYEYSRPLCQITRGAFTSLGCVDASPGPARRASQDQTGTPTCPLCKTQAYPSQKWVL